MNFGFKQKRDQSKGYEVHITQLSCGHVCCCLSSNFAGCPEGSEGREGRPQRGKMDQVGVSRRKVSQINKTDVKMKAGVPGFHSYPSFSLFLPPAPPPFFPFLHGLKQPRLASNVQFSKDEFDPSRESCIYLWDQRCAPLNQLCAVMGIKSRIQSMLGVMVILIVN